MDTNPCISINGSESTSTRHDVDTECKDFVVLAAPGTPLMDAYMNLQLVQIDPSGCEFKAATTLFLHYYNHTNSNAQASRIQVSTMNRHVQKLSESLEGQGWDTNSQNWLILWVSNQPILEDVMPHSTLLWVGRDNQSRSERPVNRTTWTSSDPTKLDAALWVVSS